MQRISVVNADSRQQCESVIKAWLQHWLTTWFTPEIVAQMRICVEFDDTLFASIQANDTDLMWHDTKGEPCLVMQRADESFSALALLALGFSQTGESTSESELVNEPVVAALREKLMHSLAQHQAITLTTNAELARSNMAANASKSLAPALRVTCELGDEQAQHKQQHDYVKWQMQCSLRWLQLLGGVVDSNQNSDSCAEASSPLVSREQATHKSRTRIHAKLSGTTLTLSDVLQLKAGDVVSLSHPLDQPMQLATPDAALKIKAYLVKQAGQKALLFSE